MAIKVKARADRPSWVIGLPLEAQAQREFLGAVRVTGNTLGSAVRRNVIAIYVDNRAI